MKNFSRTIQDTNDRVAHAHCMLYALGLKYTLKIYNAFFIHCVNGYVNAPQYYVSSIYIACLINLTTFGKNCVCYVAAAFLTRQFSSLFHFP